MDDLNPIWLGVGATAFAVAVYINGYRLFGRGGADRKMGLFHMVLAPVFVATIWTVLWMNGKLG